MAVEMITISLAEYKNLLAADAQLVHLEALGVDNWEGYSHFADDEEAEE